MSTRRLKVEFAALQKDPIPSLQIELHNESVVDWHVIMDGQKGTPYEGGHFLIHIDFSDGYPFKAPKIKFKTRIYHPNIDYESGDICLSQSREGQWKPTIKIAELLNEMVQLIGNPNLDTPLIDSAAKLYTSDRRTFDAKAREWTQLYAKSS
ncbi:putative UBC5-E2 ubiquitin-conjugating enzyme [Dimargaris cristalligena]|uniref:Putative UBC5-E2 ubiquitin-conjugating enzyme n=1 Tax=Dimargaris cristalligena TaxID=215637 RepID=A0A4P9ZQQ8_9FUNG|nr:putative UBC5-E2 ubiquitin-conjugating enzyme [Dimargaris cristalligena]|eukprot:RKP35826.1 putative UBC5-E2 ubiquitin-conjugating enzyme [Dimargaris cristalligena]